MKQYVDCIGQPLDVGTCIVYTQRGTTQLTCGVVVFQRAGTIGVVAQKTQDNRLLKNGKPIILAHNDRIIAIPANILPQMLSLSLRIGVKKYHEQQDVV